MSGWNEVILDIILLPLYALMLIRIATAREAHFKSPFFTFFLTTGLYNIITIVSYHIVAQFHYSAESATTYIFKTCGALNALGSAASTIGKVYISAHRYYVLRAKDFYDNIRNDSTIKRLLLVQFLYSLLVTAPVWPSGYEYVLVNGIPIITAWAYANTMILKVLMISTYFSYIVVNIIFTILASRELIRMRVSVKPDSSASRYILRHQRNMFIIVSACSISHFLKASHQCALALTTYLHLDTLTSAIWPFYPYINGLATYVAPAFLVIFSSKVRSRLLNRGFYGESPIHSNAIHAIVLR